MSLLTFTVCRINSQKYPNLDPNLAETWKFLGQNCSIFRFIKTFARPRHFSTRLILRLTSRTNISVAKSICFRLVFKCPTALQTHRRSKVLWFFFVNIWNLWWKHAQKRRWRSLGAVFRWFLAKLLVQSHSVRSFSKSKPGFPRRPESLKSYTVPPVSRQTIEVWCSRVWDAKTKLVPVRKQLIFD